MSSSQNLYDNLSDNDKIKILKDCYVLHKLSFADIAKKYKTYPNKIRRDAKKFNINIRNKSQAQSNAINTGKHKHPTKGTKRSDDTKQKIGKGVLTSWENLSDSDLKNRKLKAKINWENKDEEEKKHMQQSAINAVRETSKTGSKLEKYIHKKLLSSGYKVEFHKEQSLVNTKLQLDLFLPSINTVIEVDGPSHFAPVWGSDALKKNIAYDKKKEGLITGKGWNLIRVKQTKDFSPTRAETIVDQIVFLLDKECSKNKTAQKFTIED